jgi:hypothetical protein
MKTFKTVQLLSINIAIYAFAILLTIGALSKIWKLTDTILLNPTKELSDLRIDNPIIRPFNNDVFLLLKSDILKSDHTLYQSIQHNELIFKTIKDIVSIVLLILITMQLKTLFYSLKNETFFILENLLCVRKISYLLGIWVIIEFILYQCFQFFIPLSLVKDNYNYIPINKGTIISLLFSIDYLKLLAAFAFYVISVVFKEGYQLKEQSDLTI